MLLPDLGGTVQQVSKGCRVRAFHVRQRSDFALGDDEDVYRSNRRHVMEGQALVVLKDFVAGDFTGKDAAKDGSCRHIRSVLKDADD